MKRVDPHPELLDLSVTGSAQPSLGLESRFQRRRIAFPRPAKPSIGLVGSALRFAHALLLDLESPFEADHSLGFRFETPGYLARERIAGRSCDRQPPSVGSMEVGVADVVGTLVALPGLDDLRAEPIVRVEFAKESLRQGRGQAAGTRSRHLPELRGHCVVVEIPQRRACRVHGRAQHRCQRPHQFGQRVPRPPARSREPSLDSRSWDAILAGHRRDENMPKSRNLTVLILS